MALLLIGCENPTSPDDGSGVSGGGDGTGTGTGSSVDADFSATADGQTWSAADASVTFSGDYPNISGETPEEKIDI